MKRGGLTLAFNDRLKEARISCGLTQKELAKELGIASTTVTGYEKGNSEPSINTIGKIIEILHIDANFLWQDEMRELNIVDFSIPEMKMIRKYRDLDTHGKEMVDIVLDREYSRSIAIKETAEQEEGNLINFPVSPYKASAGSGYLLFDEEPDEIWSIVSNSETRKADIGITVSGDSMEPLYYDSDVLLVRKQPDINIGEIGIFIKDGQGYVKKKGNDRLISINKSRSDIYPSENEEILCFGKVIGKLKPEWVIRK